MKKMYQMIELISGIDDRNLTNFTEQLGVAGVICAFSRDVSVSNLG
jgi:hypothetical protein